MTLQAYQDFLTAKAAVASPKGLMLASTAIHRILKDHQRAIVQWAIAGGCRAIFAAFGLGKTVIQLEIVSGALKAILAATGTRERGLIVAPLGVRQEFMRDAGMLGIPLKFIRTIEEAAEPGLYITNYEPVRDGKLDPAHFAVTSLDEASCLRGFGGTKTFREFMRLFAGVRYRYVATATPSPNDYIELLAYAAYLGIMDVGEAKTRFFKRNSEKADELTLHPHKEEEFWLWVSSWAIFLQKPSDLGFSDEGYDLPPMQVHWHEVNSDILGRETERDGQGILLRDAAIGVIEASREKRDSLANRVSKLLEIVLNGRERTSQTIPEGILPEKSRTLAGRAAGSRGEELSGQSGRVQGPLEGLARSEPRASSGTSAKLSCPQPGEGSGAQPALVSEQQGAGQREFAPSEAGSVWPDGSRLSGDAGSPESSLCDLSLGSQNDGAVDQTVCRPLPQDGEDPWPPVPEMQFRPGHVRGQRTDDIESGGLFDQIIIWCDLNDEQRAIEAALTAHGISVSSLYGQQDPDLRDEKLAEWKAGKTQVFLSKPMMYGAGVNLQQSHTMVFAGIGFKFQDFIQAIHRVHRFLQANPVAIHVIHTENEREVRRKLIAKWKKHEHLVAKMSEIIRKYRLNEQAMAKALERSIGVDRIEVRGEAFTCVNNDTVLETSRMADNSVGLVVTSIPFSTQYEYTPSYNDFGHTDDDAHFWQQMDFLTPQLLRVLQPGRWACVHVKDRIIPGGINGLGFQTVSSFHSDCIYHFKRHGFAFMGMKTITTDVVRENNQTYRLGWTEQCKDASKMGVGTPEYLLLFRKPQSDGSKSYADVPVVKAKKEWDADNQRWINEDGYSRARWQVDAHAFTRSSGDRPLTAQEIAGLPADQVYKIWKAFNLNAIYDFEHHVMLAEALEMRGALPPTFMLLPPHSVHDDVWSDVARMLTLNGAQHAKGKEMHLCPLQFDIVDRAIEQLSNPGDLVLDPFGGLMTVPFRAIRHGRRGLGVELNPGYFLDGVAHCQAAERQFSMPSLFDYAGLRDAPAIGEAAE